MMRFLYDNCRKLISKGGISDIKIGLKSCNRFASVRQVYTYARFCHERGIFKRNTEKSSSGKCWRKVVEQMANIW